MSFYEFQGRYDSLIFVSRVFVSIFKSFSKSPKFLRPRDFYLMTGSSKPILNKVFFF